MAKGNFSNGRPNGLWQSRTGQSNGRGGDNVRLLFRRGRLLKVNGQRFEKGRYHYYPKEFVKNGTLSEPEDED